MGKGPLAAAGRNVWLSHAVPGVVMRSFGCGYPPTACLVPCHEARGVGTGSSRPGQGEQGSWGCLGCQSRQSAAPSSPHGGSGAECQAPRCSHRAGPGSNGLCPCLQGVAEAEQAARCNYNQGQKRRVGIGRGHVWVTSGDLTWVASREPPCDGFCSIKHPSDARDRVSFLGSRCAPRCHPPGLRTTW